MQKASNWVGNSIAILVLGATTMLAFWLVLGSWLPKTPLELAVVFGFFIFAPIGALWMLYDCVMRERPPFSYFLLAFVPYGFVWYYLKRVHPRNRRADTRSPIGA